MTGLYLPLLHSIQKHKKVFLILFFVALVILAPMETAHAFIPPPSFSASLSAVWSWAKSFVDCLKNPITCAVYFVTYAVATILGGFVMLGAFFTELSLKLNQDIVNAPAVQAGAGVALAIANLGFVLAIIVIAIGTILRNQSYGMKQALWRLIAAAILVNFSLVIGGAIIGFANGLALALINSATGVGGFGGYFAFVSKLVGAFAPQALWNTPLLDPSKVGLTDFMQTLMNLVFIILFLGLIAITFFALAVLFLIRYVALGLLLILMPFVWLMWIFQKTRHLWSKWWDHFIRWAMFAPLAIFFLYLAIFTVSTTQTSYRNDILSGINVDSHGQQYSGQIGGSVGSAIQGLIGQTGVGGFIGTVGQMVMVLGLAWGALFISNKLSIIGATQAMGAAQGAGKGFANWAYRRGGYTMSRIARGPFAPPRRPEGTARTKEGYEYSPLPGGYLQRTAMQKTLKGWLARGAAPDAGKMAKMKGAAAEGLVRFGAKEPTDFRRYGVDASKGEKGTGLLKSVFKGMKDGSGLFKKKKEKVSAKDAVTLAAALGVSLEELKTIYGIEVEKAPTPPPPSPPPSTPPPAGGGTAP